MTTGPLAEGSVFAGDYRIVRPLSSGGMGAVYVATQLSTGKERALKVMQPQLVASPDFLNPLYAQVGEFHTLGGQLLFGTDVGYMTDYSTEGGFEALSKCGLDWQDVLAMLTVNPASRFGVAAQKGSVEPGKLADLTVLDADPAQSLANFSRVRMTIRSGRILWQRP